MRRVPGLSVGLFRAELNAKSASGRALSALVAAISQSIGSRDQVRILTMSQRYGSGTSDQIRLTMSRVNMIQHTSMRFVLDATLSKPEERALRQRARTPAKSKKSASAKSKRRAGGK